jgi:predicted DCC family thiol-disulfide oxidoreductase YuxK
MAVILPCMGSMASKYIVFFDGVCNLCDGAVQFFLKRDKKKKFLFGSLQGKTGQEYLRKYHLPSDKYHSFMLIEGNILYTRSTAALRMMKHLGRGWQLLYLFIYLPQPIRDGVYNLIAANRYKWFGKKDQCRLPTPDEKERFLD